MKTLKQLEKARDNAERRACEWYYDYEDELVWHCVNLRGDMVSLIEAFSKVYQLDCSVADAIEASKLKIYEKDDDDEDFGVYNECTRRAISRLRYLERKIKEWNEKRYYLACATEIVHEDGTPYAYCEDELADITRNLAALGVSI